MIEADYMRAFLARASAEFRDTRFFRRNVGQMSVDGRVFKSGIKGQCDLWCVTRGGLMGEIELKKFGALTPEQMAWRDWCLGWCVPYLLLRVKEKEHPTATIDRWITETRSFLPDAP